MLKIILIVLCLNLVFVSPSLELTKEISELEFLSEKIIEPKKKWDDPDLPFFNNTELYIDGTKGYMGETKTLSNYQCYKQPNSNYLNLEGKLKFGSKYSFSEMTNEMVTGLKIDLKLKDGTKIGKEIDPKDPAKDGKLHIPFDINIGMDLKFTDFFSQSEMSSSMYYYTVHYRKRIINYPLFFKNAVSEEWKEVMQANEFKFDQFKGACGDEIVSNLREGAIIIVAIKINFNSKSSKQIFDMKATANVGEFFDLTNTFKNTMNKLNIGGVVQVEGVQRGGDPSEFAKMFPDNKSNECAGIVDPDIKDQGGRQEALRRCMEFVNRISDYIRQDFPRQFSDKNNLSAFYPLSVETRKLDMLMR